MRALTFKKPGKVSATLVSCGKENIESPKTSSRVLPLRSVRIWREKLALKSDPPKMRVKLAREAPARSLT